MPLPDLNVCFLHFSAFPDHVHISLSHIWWLSRGWCRGRGKEEQGDKQREPGIAHGNSRQTCQGKSWTGFRSLNLSLNLYFLSREKWGWERKVQHFSMSCHGAATSPGLKVWGIGSGAASLAWRCPHKAELSIKLSPTGCSTGRGEGPSSFPLSQRPSEALGKSNCLALNFAV